MKARISNGKEKLTDFTKGFVYHAPRKRKFCGSSICHWFWGTPRFEQPSLGSFYNSSVQSRRVINGFWKPQQSIRKFGALPLFAYSEEPVLCPECGHVDIGSHGAGENKVLAGSTRRWKCNLCGHTFRWDVAKGLKLPLSLWDVVISSFVKGDSLRRINEAVITEASKQDLDLKGMSSDAICSIAKRSSQVFGEFEKFAIHYLAAKEVKLKTVQIDFSPYILYTPESKGRQVTLEKKSVHFDSLGESQLRRLKVGKPVMAYLTGTTNEESHYLPSVVTGWGFNHRYSLECLRKMLETMGTKPQVIKCDGFKGHVKAVKMLLPDVKLISKTKRQYYGIVNLIERVWSEFKTECLHKHRFRTLTTLSYAVELKRIQHNLLRPHMGLNGLTPAEFLQIRIPRDIIKSRERKWENLLKLAYQTINIEKAASKCKRPVKGL